MILPSEFALELADELGYTGEQVERLLAMLPSFSAETARRYVCLAAGVASGRLLTFDEAARALAMATARRPPGALS